MRVGGGRLRVVGEVNPQKQMSGRTREQIGVIEAPRLQAKTGVCSVQWSGPS